MAAATNHGSEARLSLKLALDLLLEVEETIGSQYVPLLDNGDTNSVSGTVSKMRSLTRANRLGKDLDRKIQEVVDRCVGIARHSPDLSLDDGTTPTEVQARALLARANLWMVSVPAMNVFKRKKVYKEITEILDHSISLYPHQISYKVLGFCLERLKNRDKAAEAFRKCIDMDPDSDEALAAAKQLRALGLL